MSLLAWSSLLNVGVQAIDEQHKQLVSCINDLQEATERGEGRMVLPAVLEKLAHYAREHMATEEAYFDQLDYPGAAAHKQAHLFFGEKIAAFQDRLKTDDPALLLDMMKFLADWLINHIQETDRAYMELARRGKVK